MLTMTRTAYVALAAALAALAAAVALIAGGGSQATAQTGLDLPTATVVPYAGAGEPSGWLIADGRAVSRTTYAALYAAIGTTYGAGDGATTFNLPDFRGRAVVGKGTHAEVDNVTDNDGLAVGSRKVKHRHGKGSLAVSSSGAHFHYVSDSAYSSGPPGAQRQVPSQPDGGNHWRTNTDGAHAHPSSAFSGEVGDTAGPLDGPGFQVQTFLIKT